MWRLKSMPRVVLAGYAAAVLLLAGCRAEGDLAPHLRDLLANGPSDELVVAQIEAAALPLPGADGDYDALLAEVGDATVVLIGESTHGTHEFYAARAAITQRLIAEHGFDAVAIEANWPEALLVNEYVRGSVGAPPTAEAALAGFGEFPRWMWRNTDVLSFVEWLHDYNAALPPTVDKVGFYGIDLQTLSPAMEGIVDFLATVNPALAEQSLLRYECLDAYRADPIAYGADVAAGLAESCAAAVAAHVHELERWATSGGQDAQDAGAAGDNPGTGGDAREATFSILQSARMLARAEGYFRAAGMRDVSTWNLRDQYMADVVDRLLVHLGTPGAPAKIVVWAHNTHVGSALATERAVYGELNLGQLLRGRWGEQVRLVGFTTYAGEVMAASRWGEAPRIMQVLPAQPGSYAAIFHATGVPRFLLILRDRPVGGYLNWLRPQRAIGVVYQPQLELFGHYFDARLGAQFDAVIHFDETSAVTPLDPVHGDEVGLRSGDGGSGGREQD